MIASTIWTVFSIWMLTVPVRSFDCAFELGPISYDLSPLAGVRTATKETQTPPTTSEARATLDLCGKSGVPKEEGVSDEDQCEDNTRVCLKLLNHKPSASDPDRVTAVIPLWIADSSEVSLTSLGKDGNGGVSISVQGPEYAGVQQVLNLTLLCDRSAKEPNPSFISYGSNLLTLEWSRPEACPRTSDGSVPESPNPGGGFGFFGFIKFMLGFGLLILLLYFAIGMFYNHQQYSARGWDLIPHRDFWREIPVLIQDLFSHILAGLRGGSSGGRSGYSSLG